MDDSDDLWFSVENQCNQHKVIKICYKVLLRMWQAYQYGQGKLKLVKDLKTGHANLRVSLIDQEQINDIGRIYKERKKYYKIDDQSMNAPQTVQQEPEEEGTAHLSYKEKVELYRRRLQSQKLQDKYNNLFKKTEKKRFQMRNPVLFKMLQNFEQNHKHQDHLKVADDLKESQKNLQMIKINTNRMAKFEESFLEDISMERPRFLSMENGLPEKQRRPFPRWVDYAEGKFVKADRSKQIINMAALQANLDSFIGLNQTRSKKNSHSAIHHAYSSVSHGNSNIYGNNSLHREMSAPFQKQKFSPSARIALHHQASARALQQEKKEQSHPCQRCKKAEYQSKYDDQLILNRGFKSHSAVTNPGGKRMNKNKTMDIITNNATRTFMKSENCSRDVIQTMSGFYNSKAKKKTEYKKMVLYLKNDRPLTSEIRRRNYKMIGQTQLKDVKQYRNCSEKDRLSIRDQNYQFYMKLLKKMEAHQVPELPLSGKIIERIRVILESNYILTKNHFQVIAEPSLYEQRDPLSETLLFQVQNLIKKHSQ